jgi:mannose-6-phosphate isomerase-like protein (cupin superfamily)
MKRLPEKIVEKQWGREIWVVNNNEYCGKILEFNAGSKFSMHFHVLKRETFFVSKGKLILNYFDLQNANKFTEELNVGDVVDIDRYFPHQIEAIEDSSIIEFSTQHFDSDSYRVEKGDSQK